MALGLKPVKKQKQKKKKKKKTTTGIERRPSTEFRPFSWKDVELVTLMIDDLTNG